MANSPQLRSSGRKVQSQLFPPDGGVHGGDEERGEAVQLAPQEDSGGEGEEPFAQENDQDLEEQLFKKAEINKQIFEH